MASLLSYALTNVSDVKESLGIAASDLTWDNLITRKINQATRQIEAYCGRRFKETTYTEELYAAPDTDQIVLRQRPITSTVSLGVRDTQLNQDDFETVDTNLYFVNTNSGVLDLDFRAIGHWGQYQVTYTAGYATIPEDLAEACASLAAYYTLNASPDDIGKQLIREGQREVRYASTNLNFESIMANLGIDSIINSYANFPVQADV